MHEEVLLGVGNGVARITINRPERRNAMSYGVMEGLREAMAAARADDDVRVVVLTGAGDQAFCAGADLGGIAENEGAANAHEGRGLLADLFRDMWSLGKPIIARVHGYALAGGFGLACACDLVVAADDAVFGTPEINVGLWPYMITVPLLRSMPPKTALDLMMTGRRVDADEGAAHRVRATRRARRRRSTRRSTRWRPSSRRSRRSSCSGVATRSTACSRWTPTQALAYLQGMLTVTTLTEDAAEGVAAFAEKRARVEGSLSETTAEPVELRTTVRLGGGGGAWS